MLKEHNSVIVSINHPLQNVPDKVYNVSSLCDAGHSHCSVPGCFQRDTPYALQIYTYDDHVPKILVDEPNVLPDCGPGGISDLKNPNGADGKVSDKLLILLGFCFWIVFHLERPR